MASFTFSTGIWQVLFRHMKIRVLSDNAVTVDLNHPMAGQDLHFIGKIMEVRQATEEELDHGHPHGISGHEGH